MKIFQKTFFQIGRMFNKCEQLIVSKIQQITQSNYNLNATQLLDAGLLK